jgi:hypothetical protein
VDLAGSESVKVNETLGDRFKEAKTINSDLLELGIVVRKESCHKFPVLFWLPFNVK